MTENPSTPTPDTTASTDLRAVVVPERPALEGLEDKWSRTWADNDTYAFDRTQPRENVYSIDTPPPTVSGSLHVGPRLLLQPHRPDRALPADAGQGRLLPDRLGRQRPADRAPRPELLRRPLRPRPALRRRLHAAGEARPQEAGPDQPAQLHRAVRAARRRGREGLRDAVAPARPLGAVEPDLHDDRRPLPHRQPARVPAQLRPRRGLPLRGAHPVGRHLPDRRRPGRARGPRLPRSLPPRRVPPPGRHPAPHRDDPSRADPERRRADRAPRRRALPGPLRHHRHLAGLRRRDPGPGPPRRRARQGRRHRDVLHLRRPHRRHVVARAEPPGPHRGRPRRPPAPRDARVARGRRRVDGVRRAGRQDDLQRPRGDGGAAARGGRPRRRAEGDPADGELLREGRQAARDRRDPPVVHHQRRQGRGAAQGDARPGRGDHLDPHPHEAPLRQLGRRPQRRLAHLPPALLRHPVPRLVPRRRRRRARPRPPADAVRGPAPDRPVHAGPRTATPRTSAAGPAASSATPT